MDRTAKKALKLICATVGGVTALFVLAETLICAVSLLGVSNPENGSYAINTYIIKSRGFQLSVFLLSLVSLIAYWRTEPQKEKRSHYRYAMGALGIRVLITVISGIAVFVLSLMGIEGGVDPLMPVEGYLMRMIEPLINVVTIGLSLVFSVVFACAYFATVSELAAKDNDQNSEE